MESNRYGLYGTGHAAELPPNRVAEIMFKATGIRKTGDQCRTRWTKVSERGRRIQTQKECVVGSSTLLSLLLD